MMDLNFWLYAFLYSSNWADALILRVTNVRSSTGGLHFHTKTCNADSLYIPYYLNFSFACSWRNS